MAKPGRFRRAMTALKKLIADKEDTKQVFIILEAMAGNSGLRSWRRFQKAATAKAILSADRPLMAHLMDREALAAMPEGSLGRAYHRFTELEQISADGLVDASVEGREETREMTPEQVIFHDRQRDAHDLWHVVTGYGRDPLGELSLLAVTWRQLGNPGILMIIAMGYYVARQESPELKIGAALREGFRRGKKGQWLPAAHWEELLPRPLNEVRAELGFARPDRYRAVIASAADLQTAGLPAE